MGSIIGSFVTEIQLRQGGGVSRTCRGLQKEAYNYGWRFEDETKRCDGAASASVREDAQQQSTFHNQGGGLDDVAIADSLALK